jgi:RimJ/RimL family protein N-acetyltransferase
MKKNNKKSTSLRLVARAVTRADLDFWKSIYEDPEVQRQMYSAPFTSKTALWDYLRCEQQSFTVWQNEQRIGGFLLSQVAHLIGTFSIVIHKEFRGIGYGKEVMNLLEAQAKKSGYMTLRADIYADNASSIKLMENRGFRRFVWYEKNL